MSESVPRATRADLLHALEAYDAKQREQRAERIEWLADHEFSVGVVMGRMDTMALMREARECFVDGHFIGSLMLSMAFIEHTVVEELTLLGHAKPGIQFQKALSIAGDQKVFDADWLDATRGLTQHRNPFAHLRDAKDVHTYGQRFRKSGKHPSVVLEADAKSALALVYKFFRATLRHVEL